MAITRSNLEDFPRSDGAKPTFETRKTPVRVEKDDQLFKRKKPENNKQFGKQNKKKHQARKNESIAPAPAKLSKVVIENMTLSRLVEGLTIYGCILEIDEFELKFSVTGGVVIKVPIMNISSPYAKLIEDFANDSSSDTPEIAKLSALFQIGDYYPVKILSKKVCDQFGHTEIIGSINPKDIYSNFSAKTVNNLHDGYNLLAAVSSLEDYGYEMDIGVNGVKAFLPLEDLKKSGCQTKLNIGQLMPCSLLRKNERSILLTTNKKLANSSIELTDEPSIYSYVPGTRVKCIITEIRPSGLEISLPGGYSGFVPRYHISDDIMTLPNKFTVGDAVDGHVLYMQPHTKQVCVSLKSKLSKKLVKTLVNTIQLGLIIKGAVICGVGEFGRVLFKLPSNSYAVSLRKNLCEPTEYETLKLNGQFAVGTSHLCRVKKFHLFDNLIEISLRKSFIEGNDLSPSDLAVGAIVEGTVKKFKENGIYVRLGFGLNGFIPNMHLTDAPFVNLAKNREKMFAEKKTLKCRITRLDTTTKVPKISLTIKKSLLALKETDIFSDFSDIKPGMSSTGVACLINSKGVLLEFFGHVAGFIPLKYLATYQIDHPEKVFSIGQLIKCTVVSVDVRAQRMVCSLIDINETKKLKLNTDLTEKKLLNSSLQVGQILRKLKIITKTANKGLDLTNDKQNIQVFLSLAHLSDNTYLSRLLFTGLKVGDVIDQVMVFSVDSANVVTVTRKSSFIASKDCLVTSEDDIQLKQPFPAVVRNVTHNGIFFETPNAHFGVIRRKFIQDGFYEEPHKLGLIRGQTIFVTAFDHVIHSEEENDKEENEHKNEGNQLKRFKFSMRLSDVWDRESEAQVTLMKNYLVDYSLALQRFKAKAATVTENSSTVPENSFHAVMNKFISYSIGQVVTYVVTSITDEHIEVKISLTGSKNESTVSGLAVKYTDFSDLSVSHMGNAVVCDYDFDRKALLVFIQPQPAKIVRQVRNSQKSNSFVKNIKIGQLIKGTVIYCGQRYVLASLGGHAPGVIAYIPSRRHQNDLSQIETLFTVGEDYHFSVMHTDDTGRVIAILNTDGKKSSKSKGAQKETVASKSSKKAKTETVKEDLKKVATAEIVSLVSATTTGRKCNPSKDAKEASQNDFQWDIPDLTPNLNKKRKNAAASDSLNEGEDWDKLLSDSDSDEEAKGKKRRKTREERGDEARQRESELRQKEIELSNTERTPKDKNDFEMAVLASPNSSLVWLKYMSFYLEKGDIAQARAIAERALERISFREEKEKLNVWIGLMNLENTYGDQASMDALVERAIKYNDPKTIYLQLASIYDSSNKKEKAEQTYHLTLKKFKQDKSTLMEFLVFYMSNERLESARKLFQKSLLTLEKRDHVDVISKFAQLEFRYGDSEKAKTIFESMLATYWKRLDQWSIYIDMLVKYTLEESNLDSVEFVRNIFERLITFKLPPQKMKFIFKKYYDFEAKFSSENSDNLDRIKQKALEYIESDIF